MQNQYRSASFRNSTSRSSGQQTLGRSLQVLYKTVANFMVHQPQASVQSPLVPLEQRYSAKARLYPYLPQAEEQRDWLERTYLERTY